MGKKNKNPSVNLEDFLNFVEQCIKDHQTAYKEVGVLDREQQVLLHDFEDEVVRAERNKMGTKLHQLRKDRRKAKDTVKALDRIVKFFNTPKHASFLKQLRGLVKEQKTTEEFLNSDRVYKPKERSEKLEDRSR